ncbi:uncharacterized protein TRAVEDRAFT_133883, partial [Trametes versicolor FP-101664 SS1]|uniref:uncharacterized protein n=1 Tax=Trametes versicolor (strain FP-101664) TaxID=717944 RepID=UPI000462156D
RLKKRWNSPMYAFYHEPTIKYVGPTARHALTFRCAARSCDISVNRFLDKKDQASTSNLQRHAKRCWGHDAVREAKNAKNVDEVRDKIVGSLLRDGSITEVFERKTGTVTYSHRAHTYRALLSLLKTGHPGYFVPSPSTVSRDLKVVFVRTRNHIAKVLQEYEGDLHFASDEWSAPNHRAFMAITVHFVVDGKPVCLLLDFIEVAWVHSGVNLASAFAGVLKEFGIAEKVR